MRRLLIGLGCLLWIVGIAAAQDASLTAQDTTVATQTDLYGQEMLVAEGPVAMQHAFPNLPQSPGFASHVPGTEAGRSSSFSSVAATAGEKS